MITRWTKTSITKLDKMLNSGWDFCSICCEMSQMHPVDIRDMIDIIDQYGLKKAIEMELYMDDFEADAKKAKLNKNEHRNTLSKVVARARSLGMSYGNYVISEQYKIDVAENMYQTGG